MTIRSNSRHGRNESRTVAVIGAGYVGLPTAATLAHFGHRVVLAERDESRLAALRSGKMPIVEAGLDDLVAESVLPAPCASRHRPSRPSRGRVRVLVCPLPKVTTARPTCPTWSRRRRRWASSSARGHRGQQVDRPGRFGHHGRAGHRPT
jgi:hypothetical protein